MDNNLLIAAFGSVGGVIALIALGLCASLLCWLRLRRTLTEYYERKQEREERKQERAQKKYERDLRVALLEEKVASASWHPPEYAEIPY